MATVPVPVDQPATKLNIHEDTSTVASDSGSIVVAANPSPNQPTTKVLSEVSGNESQTRPLEASPSKPLHSVGELATELENFHIASPQRQDDQITFALKSQELQPQPSTETNTSIPLDPSANEVRGSRAVPPAQSPSSVFPEQADQSFEDPLKYHSLVLAAQNIPSNSEQIARHQAATPIEVDSIPDSKNQGKQIPNSPNMSIEATPTSPGASAVQAAELQIIVPESPAMNAASPVSREARVLSRESTPHRGSPLRPVTRIEDSFEALDQFEEEVEAVTQAAQLSRVLSPEAGKASNSSAKKNGLLRQNSTRAKSRQGSGDVKPRQTTRDSSVRRSVVPSSAAQDEKPSAKAPVKKAPVARPASLLPPKPLSKTTRPPTIPTFELPGEAVARKLKEKREARLSLQVNSEQLAAATPKRAKSLRAKPPTIPNFELPGEAISRRKREEHAARLKAQEEELRKRREFKARPIRTSIAPSTVVRETATSRARTAKTPQQENSAPIQSTSAASKRLSVAPGPRTSRPSISSTASSTGPPSRGRELTVGSASATQLSRATSSSTGSISGKRSTMSAEDMQQQKIRGKEILQRDNNYLAEREREKREREEAAKVARQEAAERSRMLSRQWAEKQRQKKLAATVSVSAANPDVIVR